MTTQKSRLRILCDADMLMFICAAAVEKEVQFGDIVHLYSSVSDAKRLFTDRMDYLLEDMLIKMKYKGSYDVIMCISDDTNFRKEVLPDYKANRKDVRKPVCYKALTEWVKEEFRYVIMPTLEADDVMGILATEVDNSVIMSGDKDLKMIPTKIYNILSNELTETNKEESHYLHMYQTLIGDTTDNYKGCPKMGPVSAKKLLDKTTDWKDIVTAYEKQGLTEEDALQQARVAYILQDGDYDREKEEVVLWNP